MPPLGISNISAGPLSKATAWSRLRGPLSSVGTGVCKYGPTLGYANPNGVTGFVGPPAETLQKPTNWYVRVGGSNNNGGSSTSLTPERTGSDGSMSGNTAVFTSASAAFTQADVGKGIWVLLGGSNYYAKIISVTNSTTVVLDHAQASGGGSGMSWAIGGAWATPVFLNSVSSLNFTTGVYPGDTLYLGAGTYRLTMTLGTNLMASFSATGTVLNQYAYFNGVVNIVGDVTGQYTGDAGMVQLTAYTTNDKTAPSASNLLNLNGKSNLSFSNIMFVGGNNTMIQASTATSQNITFTDCVFHGAQAGNLRTLQVNNSIAALSLHWLFDRCIFVGNGGANPVLSFVLITLSGGSDYDADVTIRNCSIPIGNASSNGWCQVLNSGTNTFKGGGIKMRNVFALTGNLIVTIAAQISTIFPCSIYNSFIWASTASAALNAGTSGQIIEDYNLFVAAVPRTNVTAGAHSISDGSYAPLFHAGQERIWNALLRPFGEPMASSPLLGFGNDGGQTPYDLMNRPRPAGGVSLPTPSVGALERSNTASQQTLTAPPSGTYEWTFTGPGYQDFLLPVDTTSTTIAINVYRQGTYSPAPGGTNPAMIILPNGRLGIPGQTIVDTGFPAQWNTLTATPFTPSGTGWVTVRIASYDGDTQAFVAFANLTVT